MRHTICSVIPPYVLEAIAIHGDADQRAAAVSTLSVDHTLRAQRIQASFAVAVTPVVAGPGLGGAAPQPHRTVYDAQGTHTLPGQLARAEGSPDVSDLDINQAYDGLGDTFTFYDQVYDRNSIDGRGLPMIASAHVGNRWDNAQWNGSQMLFGDGDGQIFGHFTASLDVIGHELAHGVTQYEGPLVYQDQPGALNESMSDVFGVMIKQYALDQTAEDADWLIGAELMLPGFQGVALRSMKAPGTAYDDPRLGGKDPQPAHMRDYITTTQDFGGVHLNSGIPNHAFHLAARHFGGYSWERAGAIWYSALRDPRLRPTASFRSFARATVRAARLEFGETDAKVVRDAWQEVGVRAA